MRALPVLTEPLACLAGDVNVIIMWLIVSLEPRPVPPRRAEALPVCDGHRPGLGAGEGSPMGLTSLLNAEGWLG